MNPGFASLLAGSIALMMGAAGNIDDSWIGGPFTLIRTASTRVEMHTLRRMLLLDMIAGEELPKDIGEYARVNLEGIEADSGSDSWGSEWSWERDAEGGRWLISCGPDRTCFSEDDLRVRIVYSEGGMS